MGNKVVWIILVSMMAGCAMRDTSNVLDLDEKLLKNNHESIEQLYASWIEPVSKKNAFGTHEVNLGNTQEWYDAQDSLRKGFVRYCNIKQGKYDYKNNKNNTGFDLICRGSGSKLFGKLTVVRLEDNKLGIEFDSPKRVAQRKQVKLKFVAMKQHNGPTGKLTTTSGEKLKFIRIGNFYEPNMWFVKKGNDKLFFSDIKMLVFRSEQNYSLVDVTLLNNVQFTVNEVRLGYQKSPFFNVMGGDFFIVLVDEESGQPYTKIFPWFDGISSIIFDDRQKWGNKKIFEIKTTYNPVSKEKRDEYFVNIQDEARSLYTQLRNEGIVGVYGYFKGDMFAASYAKFAHDELIRFQNEQECLQTVDKGIKEPLTLLQCLQAKDEYKAFSKYDFIQKYRLDIKSVPLTALIILKRVKREMRRSRLRQ